MTSRRNGKIWPHGAMQSGQHGFVVHHLVRFCRYGSINQDYCVVQEMYTAGEIPKDGKQVSDG